MLHQIPVDADALDWWLWQEVGAAHAVEHRAAYSLLRRHFGDPELINAAPADEMLAGQEPFRSSSCFLGLFPATVALVGGSGAKEDGSFNVSHGGYLKDGSKDAY